MYGQQEVGGIVNTVLKKPQDWRFARMGLVVGGFGTVRPTLDVNTPLTRSGSALVRVNAAYEHSDSHRDHVEQKSYYLAPSAIWKLSGRTRLRLNAEFQKFDYVFDTGVLAEPEFLAGPVSAYYGEPGYNNTKTAQRGATLELSHAINTNWNLRSAANGLITDAEPNLVNPTSLTADRQRVNRSSLRSEERSRNYSWQNEVYGRVSTGPLNHNFVVGTDVVRWDFRYIFYTGSPAAPAVDRVNPVYGTFPTTFVPFFNDHTTADIVGAFVQDQIAVGTRVRLLTGLRFDRVEMHSKDAITGVETNARTLDNVAPRIGLLVNPTRSTAVYGSYTNSFLPQYGVSRTGERFDPQQGRQYELGIKQHVFGDRLLATLSAFELWKTNVPTTDPVDARFSVLTGEQRSRGVELELAGNITRRWSVLANYAALDAFVSEDNRLRVGSKLIGVPKHAGGVWTTLDVDAGALSGLRLGGGLYAASKRQARLPNVATEIPSYWRVDLLAAYRTSRWTVQANVKNLTDEKWYEAQGANLIPQAPRHLLVTLGYQFQ